MIYDKNKVMHPFTHLLLGWTVANASPLERRDRALVTLAGVIPDVDGVGAIPEQITLHSDRLLSWYSEYHHVLAHNVGFAVLTLIFSAIFARRRWTTASLAMASFHLHLLGDLAGSRGQDGYQWPIPYLLPFSDGWRATWEGQWQLNAWPNFVITLILLIFSFYLAWKRGYSPVELISPSADQIFIRTLRNRLGNPRKENIL